MAYLENDEIHEAYQLACEEATQWRKDYRQYERLADNGLLDDLDENLPEVNDGSLAASLFKLAKRVIKKNLSGRAIALDSDDEWLTELANIYWTKKILKNANSKASPRRKWKDAVRKAAIYGGQPIISLFVTRGSYTGADFIVPYALDVKLEAGKDSDEDSDVIFWDVYYSKLQIKNMIEQAKDEQKEEGERKAAKKAAAEMPDPGMEPDMEMAESPAEQAAEPDESYNKWDIDALQRILDGTSQDSRPGNEISRSEQSEQGKVKEGYHFYVSFQRGVDAPFSMCNADNGDCVREWSNPDPTGDVPVHYLYCYQDFINPYGIGIVKLAGGTQNVLDYMRQADILATQLGMRPPKQIKGDEDQVDEDSLVYAQDANWYVGNASVERMEMSSGVYQELPGRISMYQTSLQKFIPSGDTTISSSDSGDPNVGKTPQALKMAAGSLSIDDEDFAENVDECYAVVAKSMINIQFANMQGSDILKLSDEERQVLTKAGIPFPVDAESGMASNELEVIWDESRAKFDFEMDPEADKTKDEKAALDGKISTYEMIKDDPTLDIQLGKSKKKIDRGELVSDILGTLTNNDKIIVDMTDEEVAAFEQQQAAMAASTAAIDPETGKPLAVDPTAPSPDAQAQAAAAAAGQPGATPSPEQDPNALTPEEEEAGAQIDAVMKTFGVDEQTAAAMLEGEKQGYEPEEILDAMKRNGKVPAGTVNG